MKEPTRESQMLVTASLNDKEREEVLLFYKKVEGHSHFNNPLWAEFVEPYKKPLFFRFYSNNELIGFGIVYVKMAFSIMHFGPMIIDRSKFKEYIDRMALYLKDQKFGVLTFGLRSDVKFDSSNTDSWSTILISVSGKTAEDVFKDFSKGHKSAIKKALKEGLEVRFVIDSKELNELGVIYNKMHERKGLILPLPDSAVAFNKIVRMEMGKVIGVFKDGQIIGGVVVVSEGGTVLYKFGATDIRHHSLPVLHVAIFEMIKYAIDTNHEVVDLCGYTPDAKPGSYASGVNLFKKGFGGDVVAYSKIFSLKLNRMVFIFYNFIFVIARMIPMSIKRRFY